MFILNQYRDIIASRPDLSDDEFLQLQVKQLDYVFCNEAAAIKNSNLEYVAFSDRFISDFDKSGLPLNKVTYNTINMEDLNTLDVREQEQRILNDLVLQVCICVFKKNGKNSYMLMRKRPLINPATEHAVGIFIISAVIEPWRFRKEYVKQFIKWPRLHNEFSKPSLSDQQQLIVNCLLLGFNKHKDIANVLSDVTKDNYNEMRIKNSLKRLYEKFECSTPAQLITQILAHKIPVDILLDVGTYVL